MHDCVGTPAVEVTKPLDIKPYKCNTVRSSRQLLQNAQVYKISRHSNPLHELQASHMTPWPSGLRRYVQVVVYFCGRRFESHETPAEVKLMYLLFPVQCRPTSTQLAFFFYDCAARLGWVPVVGPNASAVAGEGDI